MEENKEIKPAEKTEVEQVKSLSKEEIENLINKKAVELFGDLIKELNTAKKEEPKEEPKKETNENYWF